MWSTLIQPFKTVAKVAGVGVAVGATVKYLYYRPRPSFDVEFHEETAEMPAGGPEPSAIEKTLVDFAGSFTMLGVTAVTASGMRLLENVEFVDRHKILKHVESDRDGRPLITVSNHDSVLDEPFLTGMFVPTSVLASPSRMRLTVCSEELCFGSGPLATFFSLGNGLPIQRGGTIHQKSIALLQRRVNAGGWVHLFPEARVWQENGFPLRDEQGRYCSPSGRCGAPYSKIGPFKRGIGKLVCNASKPPVIVPFFHVGMERVMPQDEDNQLTTLVPRTGKTITCGFGDPVDVAPLIEAYHADAADRAAARAKSRASGAGDGRGKSGVVAPVGVEVGELSADDAVVPTRHSQYGVPIPSYHEAPLLIKPPDHDTLSEEEALLEEAFRLQLYGRVADRLQLAVQGVEKRVRDYRKEVLGLGEVDDTYGPTHTRATRRDL